MHISDRILFLFYINKQFSRKKLSVPPAPITHHYPVLSQVLFAPQAPQMPIKDLLPPWAPQI